MNQIEYRARDQEISDLFRSGQTLQAIGDRFLLTRERVRQILERLDVSANDGGRAFKTRRKREARAAYLDAISVRRFGCTVAEVRALLLEAKEDIRVPYKSQVKLSKKRGIEWRLTLRLWWEFWRDSGVSDKRGAKRNDPHAGRFCMCRFGDLGPYEVGNIFAGDIVENLQAGRRKKKVFPYTIGKAPDLSPD